MQHSPTPPVVADKPKQVVPGPSSTLKDVPSVWTPGGGGTPSSVKKGYRPIKPEFSKPSPEKKSQVNV